MHRASSLRISSRVPAPINAVISASGRSAMPCAVSARLAAAAISTAVSGLVFSLAYLRRRSALEPVAAHAFSDVLAMLGATMLAK